MYGWESSEYTGCPRFCVPQPPFVELCPAVLHPPGKNRDCWGDIEIQNGKNSNFCSIIYVFRTLTFLRKWMIYHSIGILDDGKIVTIERKLFREIVNLGAVRGFFWSVRGRKTSDAPFIERNKVVEII